MDQLGSDRGCNDASDIFYAESSPLDLFCHHNPGSTRCVTPMGLKSSPAESDPNSNNNNNEEEDGNFYFRKKVLLSNIQVLQLSQRQQALLQPLLRFK